MRIASDELYFRDGHAFIYAAHPLDWPIREFSRVPILIRGERFYLRSKSPTRSDGRIVYELCPWPENVQGPSPAPVTYDEAYVCERDAAARFSKRTNLLWVILCPLYPMLGLLWSGFKNRHLIPLGFEPGSITHASVVMIFLLVMAEGVFVGWLASGILAFLAGFPRVVDWMVFLILGSDCVMRFSQSLEFDVQRHLGFVEWLCPRRGQNSARNN